MSACSESGISDAGTVSKLIEKVTLAPSPYPLPEGEEDFCATGNAHSRPRPGSSIELRHCFVIPSFTGRKKEAVDPGAPLFLYVYLD